MPLPQQVINQLSNEPAETPGWSLDIIGFAGGLLLVVLLMYAAMAFAFEPYINGQISNVQNQTATLGQSISSQDQDNLINFYSQISNLQGILAKHVYFSHFLSWLEQNTESNIYYTSFSFSSATQISITGHAASEADVNQQIAIFQSSPEVKNVVVSNVASANAGGGSSGYLFAATLTMNPSLFMLTSTTTPASTNSHP